MIPVTAAGGVIFRIVPSGTEVLVIRRNGHWDLPKGKLEPGESVAGCAVREVSEELGIPPPMVACSLDATWHSYAMDGASIGKTTHWFLMVSNATSFVPQAEEFIEEVRWVDIQAAYSMVAFDNLKVVLERSHRVLSAGAI